MDTYLQLEEENGARGSLCAFWEVIAKLGIEGILRINTGEEKVDLTAESMSARWHHGTL